MYLAFSLIEHPEIDDYRIMLWITHRQNNDTYAGHEKVITMTELMPDLIVEKVRKTPEYILAKKSLFSRKILDDYVDRVCHAPSSPIVYIN